MISTSPTTIATESTACFTCGIVVERAAKFCGHCGALASLNSGTIESGPITIPSFAPVAPRHLGSLSPQQREELGKLTVLLARERLFLYLHWLIFLGSNLFGFWLALKCYHEYIGDDMTKLMMSSTPLLYINCCALMCIVPIRGTRQEIARLKEQISHLRFKLEFNHLV